MTGRLRVLSVIDDLGFGGDENRLLSFATTIDPARFEHRVVTIQRPDPSRAESLAMHAHYRAAGLELSALEDLANLPGRPSPGRLRLAGAGRRLLRKIVALRRVAREWGADVIDAHLEPAALVGVPAGVLTRTPTVVTVYSPVPLTPPPLWSVAGRLTLGLASVIVTDSDARRRDITGWMRPRCPLVRVIPNGMSPPRATRSAHEVRAELGIPSGPAIRVIGQVAALAKHKGHKDLLQAARLVLARAPSTVFLLVGFAKGDTAFGEQLKRFIAEAGLTDMIKLVGYPGPIGDVWNVIDVQVHASTYDSLPNALIEGMSLGKPIVATTVGGVPDMLTHRESALLVPPHDPTTLANALVELLVDRGLAERLGAAARERHRQGYQPATMTRALEQCFAELAVQRGQLPHRLAGAPRSR
ncbi:MAG TPA: glycosyltransferase family 4 protein [Candidatus Polarisedimenticolaceae bacterium]|nr:glycosyltransferase family 4 protein [Candidatus Polarisedimenticolaceae bacterium]